MGKDLERSDRDFVDATMARGERGDELVTDRRDFTNITEIGSDLNVTKMADFTKTGQIYDVH